MINQGFLLWAVYSSHGDYRYAPVVGWEGGEAGVRTFIPVVAPRDSATLDYAMNVKGFFTDEQVAAGAVRVWSAPAQALSATESGERTPGAVPGA